MEKKLWILMSMIFLELEEGIMQKDSILQGYHYTKHRFMYPKIPAVK